MSEVLNDVKYDKLRNEVERKAKNIREAAYAPRRRVKSPFLGNAALFWTAKDFVESKKFLAFCKKRKKDLVDYLIQEYGFQTMAYITPGEDESCRFFKDELLVAVLAAIDRQRNEERGVMTLPFLGRYDIDFSKIRQDFAEEIEEDMAKEFQQIIFRYLRGWCARGMNEGRVIHEDDFIGRCKFATDTEKEMVLSLYVDALYKKLANVSQESSYLIDTLQGQVKELEGTVREKDKIITDLITAEGILRRDLEKEREKEPDKKLKAEVKELKGKVRELKGDLRAEKSLTMELSSEIEVLHEDQSEFYKALEIVGDKGEQKRLDRTKKYLFYGGHRNVLSALEKIFPESIICPDHKFTYTEVMNADTVVYLTGFMSHSMYDKMRSLTKKHNIKELHISQSGLSGILEELRKYQEPRGVL